MKTSQLSGLKAAFPSKLPEKILEQLAKARAVGQKVILVTGVFDLIHEEHQRFLSKAKALGGLLIVGVESDARVRKIKGEGRPVNSEEQRAASLAALETVDGVFILPDKFDKPEHHQALISAIKPDYLAVSSHTKHLEAKRRILEEFGGEVAVVHEHNPAMSTTILLEKMEKGD